MTKSLANPLLLKQRLHGLRMLESSSLKSHINGFISIINDLKNLDVVIESKAQALLLLCSLPLSYKNFRDTIIYGREELNFDDVIYSRTRKE